MQYEWVYATWIWFWYEYDKYMQDAPTKYMQCDTYIHLSAQIHETMTQCRQSCLPWWPLSHRLVLVPRYQWHCDILVVWLCVVWLFSVDGMLRCAISHLLRHQFSIAVLHGLFGAWNPHKCVPRQKRQCESCNSYRRRCQWSRHRFRIYLQRIKFGLVFGINVGVVDMICISTYLHHK